MINYGYLLLNKEKSGTNEFLRASYIFSNVGDLVYCYGRMIRFPECKKEFRAEIKLAIADIMMQCRMVEERYGQNKYNAISDFHGYYGIERAIKLTTWYAAKAMQSQQELIKNTHPIMENCYVICGVMGWDTNDVEHLGYQHCMERFEQFEREGWR